MLVTIFEVDTDKWLRCRSGQVKIRIVLVIFVAQGMTINLEGPFFEPSVIQTIYETVPKKDKPKIVDTNCKFMMNDRSLMKHLKNLQNPQVVYLNKSDNLI